MLRISEFILNFVLNSAWQVTAICVIAAFASWLLKNAPSRHLHTLWVIALVASLVVPLLTATRFVPAWVSAFQVTPQAHRPRISAPRIKNAEMTANTEIARDLSADHLTTRIRQPISTTNQTAIFLTLAYVLFILGRAIRLARFWRRKEKLRRSATQVGLPPEIEVVAKRCSDLLKAGDVIVAQSTQARVPYTLGARRALIVLPQAVCSIADETQLTSVIGHEMAHVARRDFLSNLICELISLPLSFHPLTYLIKRQIDRSRELSCDELVAERVLAPRVYARSLLWAADVSKQQPAQAFMLSLFDGQILEERITRLMRDKRRVGPRLARVLMLAALAVLCVPAMSLSMFSLDIRTQAVVITQREEMFTAPDAQPPVPTNVISSQTRGESQDNASTADQRAMSACKAGQRGDVAAIPSLIALLNDDSKAQPLNCWESGRWSPALRTFRHPSPGEQAAIALASFGHRAFAPLSNQLDSPNATVRRNAAWAIGELTNMIPGDRAGAVPQLITLLGDTDEWVRMAAARALGELRDERALPKLVATLTDDKWRVRQLTVWALSEMKDDRAVNALCNVLLSDPRVEVRRGAAEALGEIASAEALPSLKQALNDSEVSAKAASAIFEIEG